MGCEKNLSQVKGLEQKPLTPPSLLFQFIPLDFCLWLKQHGLKTEKENTYPAALWGHWSGLQVCLGGRERNHPNGHLVW